MAVRPVYMPKNSAPFYSIVNVDFKWNGGFAVSQKHKNIKAIHDGFMLIYPESRPLEISSKSLVEAGVRLSAFNLMKYVPELGRSVTVENVYQSGKVFANGCQYTNLLLVSPKEAKRDERLRNSGKLVGFRFDGQDFPLVPESLFYNYIYLNALLENPELAQKLTEYNGFTDIEFNPQKGLSTQAKSSAVFVSLANLGLTDRIRDYNSFIALFD
ncbi:MAG: hypothetical protein NC340_00235 [Ruminococcus flavefaciens]|nr:hypothetical protein [Ruminococcus flavefaciens]MCM1228539.1 hypothetical protein [Ruminococcus flavefaciens]